MIPDKLGPYRVIEELGGGGMGVVYLVETPDGRRAALKVLAPAWDLPGNLRRFRREAEALRRLDHPGFVRYFDHGDALATPDGARPFILMEFVEGRSLRQAIRSGGLPASDVAGLIADIASALQYAHERGITHRDLKPENIILEAHTGRPRILDLGIARLPENWRTTADVSTRAGELVGTVRYMSPEQARGNVANIGPASDVYSLAVVAYELLTGELPYVVGNDTLHELLVAILTQEPVPLRERNPELSFTIDAVVRHGLTKDPLCRPSSIRQFAEELKAATRDDRRQQIRSAWRGLRRVAHRHGRGAALAGWGLVALLLGLTLVFREFTGHTGRARDGELASVYGKLETAVELVHFGDRTPDRLRAAIDTLASARELIWAEDLSWRSPLERYATLRLGEAGYLLGMADEDPEKLRWASEQYADAAKLSCTRAEREAIPTSCPVRTEILSMGAHMPHSGHAMTLRALARFDLPLRHLVMAEHSAREGVRLLSSPEKSAIWDGPPFDESVSIRQRRIATAIMHNDYGGILSELATVSDSLEYLQTGLRVFSQADSFPELQSNRPAWASFQHQYGVALRRHGEPLGDGAELDEAERRLRIALNVRGPGTTSGAITRTELARVGLARSGLTERGSEDHERQLVACAREIEMVWNDVASRNGSLLLRTHVAMATSRIASALALTLGDDGPAERADSLVHALLTEPEIRRLPRARAELFLERVRLGRSRGLDTAPRGDVLEAWVDSARAALPPDQYPSLTREMARLRSR